MVSYLEVYKDLRSIIFMGYENLLVVLYFSHMDFNE
jgi:hypothetical protein